jgi:uncharacterized protein YcbK (DUF882 family)
MPDRRRPAPRAKSRGNLGALVLFGTAALGVVQLYHPRNDMPAVPLAHLAAALTASPPPTATPTPDAFGRSGEVKMRFAMPGDGIEFPLAIAGGTDSLLYQWVSLRDSSVAGPVRQLTSARPIAPSAPGFYRLAIVHDEVRQIVTEPTLAVMVPFDRKLGQWLNGYLIGEYLAERIGGKHETPLGFVEVQPGMEDIALTTHLKLGDFLTHDDQTNVWPKYVAVDPLLLDKLELVLAEAGGRAHANMSMDVHSGFRAPAHNATVHRAAKDSRHQYGDAADVQIDANGDGVIDMTDEILVMLAVERVEDAHPDLIGGLGVYTSRRYRTPYLHIDTRGKRSRWHG